MKKITIIVGLLLFGFVLGCAATGDYEEHNAAASLPTEGQAAPRAGTAVVALEFLYAFENEQGAIYYPIEGIGGCEYSPEGTLIFTDQLRGKVYGLDGGTRRWYEFDAALSRPYQPIDVTVDGFKVLVLDSGAGRITRHDLNGAYLDVLVEVREVDPVIQTSPSAFAVDRDGRMIIADSAQQQILMLDTFQNLNMRVGDPGTMPDQFDDPSGLAYLPDGSFMVADRGNRRLARYGRLGFFEGIVDTDGAGKNPFLAPGGMDSDRFGNLFVADSGFGVVHVLGRRLNYEFTFRGETGTDGELSAPLDVSVGPNDLLAVTDRDRAAVLVYRIIYE
ncbi:MAG: sugar lactone lactonase YvrE [Candidatus Krumholzibacteriia bacterium]|jgi:sugar lactone lactonase YvrE